MRWPPIKVFHLGLFADLDVSFGGVMSLMNLEGRYSVLDWDSYHEDEFDGKLIDQLVVKHSSGVM